MTMQLKILGSIMKCYHMIIKLLSHEYDQEKYGRITGPFSHFLGFH